MIVADKLIERCQLVRNISACFGTYPESTYPQNKSALSLLHKKHCSHAYFNIGVGHQDNHGLPTLPA